MHEVGLACHQVVGDRLFMAENHIALDEVFQFANISRPMIFLKHRQNFVSREAEPGS